MIDKRVSSFDEAVRDLGDGATLLIGGFAGFAECPSYLVAAVARKEVKGLTIVGNSAGLGQEHMKKRMARLFKCPDDYYPPSFLIERGQVRKGILAFPAAMGSSRSPFEEAYAKGQIELELIGQGSLAERIRTARAGIAGFYTPVGVGTFVAAGKEVREFDGRKYVLERALKGDFSLIRAHRADRYGNLVYRGTTRTFNATMAGASAITIAEVDEIVEAGELVPEHIVTPGVYVQRVVVRPSEPRAWNLPG